MPKVRFMPEGLEVEVEPGTTILEAARACGAPEGDACGGVCACSTCHVYVVEGYDSLSEMDDDEDDILDKAFDVHPESRLGCQAEVGTQDLVVRISDESREAFYAEHGGSDERAERAAKSG